MSALGIQNLDDLRKFRFERLGSKYFSHWYTTIPLPLSGGKFPGGIEEAKRIFNAFVCAGGLAAHREEVAVLERLRKQSSKEGISVEKERLLREAERISSQKNACRLEYREVNRRIVNALRALRWK